MFKVALNQVWQYKILWTSVLVTVASVALFISLCVNFMVAILRADTWVFKQPEIQPGGREAYLEVGANLLIYSGSPSLVVLGIVSLNIAFQLKRSHALWVLAGALPRQVVAIFSFQTLVVSVMGSTLGIVISLFLQPWVNGILFRWNQAPEAVLPLSYSTMGFCITFLVVAGMSYLSAFFPALRIRKVSVLDIYKETVAGQTNTVWRKALVPGIFGIFVILPLLATLLIVPFLPEPIYAVLVTLPLGQALVIFTALLAPLILPIIMRVWTHIPGLKDWLPWHVARHAAVARAEVSSSTVAPLMVGTGMFLSFDLVGGTGAQMASAGEVNLFDGTLMLTPLAFIATVGTIAVIFISTRQRGVDVIILRRFSATYQDVVAILICEGVIYAVSALVLLTIPALAQIFLLVFALASHGVSVTIISMDALVPALVYVAGSLGIVGTVTVSGQKFWKTPCGSIATE